MRSLMALASLVLLLILALPSHAGPTPPPSNILYGFLTTNRTLTVAPPGPFYYVPGDLVIRPGVTLTIEPDVTVAFSSADTLVGGADPSRTELTIQGHLVAQASYADSIRLVSARGGTGEWAGIRADAAATLQMSYVALRGAQTAMTLGASGPSSLLGLGVSAVNEGILGESSTFTLRDSRIVGPGSYPYWSGTGLLIGPNGVVATPDSTDPRPTTIVGFYVGVQAQDGATIQNLIVRDNYIGFQSSANAMVNYCTFARNRYGLSFYGGQGRAQNVITAMNSYVGIGGGGSATCDYIDSWLNSPNFQSIVVGPNSASFNPFFLNAAENDFRLGDGSIFKNFSNSGGEIGAYGPGAGPPVGTTRTTWSRLKALYR